MLDTLGNCDALEMRGSRLEKLPWLLVFPVRTEVVRLICCAF